MEAIRRFVCGDTIWEFFEDEAVSRESESSQKAPEPTPAPGTSSVGINDDSGTFPDVMKIQDLPPPELQNRTNASMNGEDEESVNSMEQSCESLLAGPTQATKMLPYAEADGSRAIVMTLTRSFVSGVNTVLRCENRIARYTKEINDVESEIREAEELLQSLRQQLNNLPEAQHEARSAKENAVESCLEVLEDMDQQRESWLCKLDEVKEKLEGPKRELYGELGRVFEKYNYLEDISGISESGQDELSDEQQQEESSYAVAPPSPTEKEPQRTMDPLTSIVPSIQSLNNIEPATEPPVLTPLAETSSELQAATQRNDWYTLSGQKDRLDGKLEYLHQRLEDWYLEYDDTLRGYKECYAMGETDDTRTVFDNKMFIKHRGVIQDVVVAERELKEIIEKGIALGVDFCDDDQESHFIDYADDGYRISHEQEWIDHVDYHKIEKWMNGLPDDEPPSPLEGPEGEADDWNVREIEFGESISVIAEGRPRARIDRWRSSQKQDHMTRFVEDIDTELEYQHGQQKRRCKRSHSV